MTSDTANTKEKCKDILFFDGQCPLCTKEIQWLQKHQQGTLHFKDIHTLKGDEYPPSKEAMLRKLHLLTKDQKWIFGLDATASAWSHTPYGYLIAPLRWPVIKYIADKTYQQWAKKRYKKRLACSACMKNIDV